MRIRAVLDLDAGSTRVVEATTFLTGLVKHFSIHHEGCWALTHELSGMTLLNGIPRDPSFLLSDILPLLRPYKFNVSLDRVLNDAAIVEALEMSRSRIIGKLGERNTAATLRQYGFTARPVVGSGATEHRKCDVDAEISDAILKIETKTTESDRYSLDVREFEAKRKEAAKSGRDLAYVVMFVGQRRGTVIVVQERLLPPDAIAADVSTTVTTNAINIAAALSVKVNSDRYIPVFTNDNPTKPAFVLMSFAMLRRALT